MNPARSERDASTAAPAVGSARLWRRWTRRYEESPAGAIYGTIVTAAIVGGESLIDLDTLRVIETIAVALPLYWLAHAYAELLAGRMRHPNRPSWRDARHALVEQATVLESALPPLALLLVLWLAGVSPSSALTACLWLCVLDLFTFGWVAATRSRLRSFERIVYASVTAGFGVAIVALKAVLH